MKGGAGGGCLLTQETRRQDAGSRCGDRSQSKKRKRRSNERKNEEEKKPLGSALSMASIERPRLWPSWASLAVSTVVLERDTSRQSWSSSHRAALTRPGLDPLGSRLPA
ncbi:unnamed protein product [Pleuronectes platessa]|uniref:Uncharacterized protein n=1 Tax=Pleuronectes platessa TaxID=8262 RepID=A0A9N7ZDD0_PLEPL|nr:unnamed protein product [Pleuronectes platessa]